MDSIEPGLLKSITIKLDRASNWRNTEIITFEDQIHFVAFLRRTDLAGDGFDWGFIVAPANDEQKAQNIDFNVTVYDYYVE